MKKSFASGQIQKKFFAELDKVDLSYSYEALMKQFHDIDDKMWDIKDRQSTASLQKIVDMTKEFSNNAKTVYIASNNDYKKRVRELLRDIADVFSQLTADNPSSEMRKYLNGIRKELVAQSRNVRYLAKFDKIPEFELPKQKIVQTR